MVDSRRRIAVVRRTDLAVELHFLVELGIKGVPKIKEGYNPATWMLEVTSAAQEVSLGVDFAELYKSSGLYGRNKELVKELSHPAPGFKDLYFLTQYTHQIIWWKKVRY